MNRDAYFLVSPGPVCRNSLIIHTDLRGQSLGRVVPPPWEILDFAVDNEGVVYVLAFEEPRAGAPTKVLTYEPGGKVRSSVATKRFASRLCVLQGRVVVGQPHAKAAALETLGLVGSGRGPLSLNRRFENFLMASLPDGRVAMMERTENLVQFIDPESMSSTSAVLPTPHPVSLRQPDSKGPRLGLSAVSSLETSAEGDVYLLGASYRLSDGAPLLRLNDRGTAIESIRCILPAFEELKSVHNPRGLMGAKSIGLGSGVLLLENLLGRVAVYGR